jgi:hypothetical protein
MRILVFLLLFFSLNWFSRDGVEEGGGWLRDGKAIECCDFLFRMGQGIYSAELLRKAITS